jgi:adenine-specific DNA-methyltransferase
VAGARAEERDSGAQFIRARAFGYRVVAAWWAALTVADGARQPLREPFAPFDSDGSINLPRAEKTLARKIGSSLATLDAEAAAYRAGLAYIGLLPAAHRAAHGVYYTPPGLGARLIERATSAGVDWRTARVLDPACGGGAFLAPVARQMVRALRHCEPRLLLQDVARRVRGYELDPFAAWLAQVALDAVMLPVTRACGRRLPVVVTVCDTLRAAPADEPFDLVIGNPPYARVRLDAADRRRFERSLFGHANLYGLFTDAAIRHTKPGGVIAYVTPTSFLAGEYYKKLRALLRREASPVSIEFIARRDDVFDDVLQETLLATYRRAGAVRPRHAADTVVVDIVLAAETALPGGTVDTTGFGAPVVVALPHDPSAPWILPRDRAHAALAETLATMPHRLRDWGYTVSTGPLVWNRYKNQLHARTARNRFPIVWAEAVTPDGRFVWRAQRRNHVPYCAIRAGDEWMLVRDPCVLLQRTTSKEQQRRLIAAPLPAAFVQRCGAVVVENHLNMLRTVAPRPAVSQATLAAFLNSAAADRAFRCVSGSVAVSAYELESLPVPSPASLEPLRRLISSSASKATIDAECERLYGVTSANDERAE